MAGAAGPTYPAAGVASAANVEQAKLTANDGAVFDLFGLSVSVSGDTAVVGAFQDDAEGSKSGSAYVFIRSGKSDDNDDVDDEDDDD